MPASDVTPIEPKEYQKWLGEGRKRHLRKDYRSAIDAFQKALAARPRDPQALAELGWAAHFAQDGALAESSIRAALEGTADRELRGAALFNLGVVLESSGRTTQAVKAYLDSLASRPSTGALRRLNKLDRAAADSVLTLHGTLLDGPTKSLSRFCDKDATRCVIPGSQEWQTPAVDGPCELGAKGPYQGAWVISSVSGPFGNHALAIRTAAGWYIAGPGITTNMAVSGAWSGSVSIGSLAYVDVIAGAPTEIVLTYTLATSAGGAVRNLGEDWERSERLMLICGIGTQGAPACTDPITLELSSVSNDSPTIAYKLNATFTGSGVLELTRVEGELPDAVKAILGPHRVDLP